MTAIAVDRSDAEPDNSLTTPLASHKIDASGADRVTTTGPAGAASSATAAEPATAKTSAIPLKIDQYLTPPAIPGHVRCLLAPGQGVTAKVLKNAVVSMSSDEIYKRLTEILRDLFDDDSLVATPELTASQVAGWDSFAHLRLMLTVERSFGIDFAASQITSLKNVGELAALIQSKLQ
jgi:acyl carrier protein